MRKKLKLSDFCLKGLLLVMLAVLIGSSVFAQKTTINGKVVDEQGLAIPGVTVVIKGTTNGTITDFDGNYSISVEGTTDNVLTFSFVGFQMQEVAVGTKRVVNVTLAEVTELVGEVVIVGYGQQKKETVVGSVVQTKGDELLKAGPVANVSEALSGILPGVSTMQATGQPGASEATILIRGQSSWNNNQPLFVVDGIERPFNDLDPNEIESISVLKDASATAVFGVKAANGVILITTKRGLKGKTQVSFSSNWGVKVPVMETDYMEDYATALQYFSIAAINEGKYDAVVPQSDIDAWSDPNRDPDFFSYTNWIDRMIKTGTVQSYNLNVSGGNDFVKYFTSLGYNYDGDIFNIEKQKDYDPRTSQKRYNWRSNLDFEFTKSTKLKVNLSGAFKDWHGNPITADWNRTSGGEFNDTPATNNQYLAGMFSAVQVGPAPILSDGRLGVGNRYTEWLTSNYLADLERQGEVTKRSVRVYSDVILEQQIFKSLSFKSKLSYNFNRAYASRIAMDPLYYYTDWRTGEIRQAGDKPDKVESLPRISPEVLYDYDNSLYYEMSLDFNKTINNVHNISALALFSRRKYQYRLQFPSFEESWVGRATYNYNLKYMFEFNGAYNGSEKFAPGKRFGFFPSLAVGWTLSEEPFFKENLGGFVDFMKIRYSWGQIGSDIGARRFTYISEYGVRYASQVGMFGYGAPYQTADVIYFEGTPANLNATWETATKQNLGIEMNMFSSRLHAAIDLFDEYRTGILMVRQSIPSWYGNSAPDANIGETKNHGIDIDLKWNDKINNDWSYYFTTNLSITENRIVERDDAKYTPEYQQQAGKPIGWNSGRYVDGYLNSWDDVFNYTQPVGAKRIPGDFVYVDYNADGVLDGKDIVPIQNPSYAANSFAFSFGLSFKQWSISALFNGAFGLSKQLSNSYLWEYATTGGDKEFRILKTEMQNYWTPDNSNPEHPVLHTSTNAYNDWGSTYTIRPSDYLRFKSLELKYTFNRASLERIKFLEGLEVFCNGNNLVTWTKLPDMFDPEASRLEVYPVTKRFTFGLTARF